MFLLSLWVTELVLYQTEPNRPVGFLIRQPVCHKDKETSYVPFSKEQLANSLAVF